VTGDFEADIKAFNINELFELILRGKFGVRGIVGASFLGLGNLGNEARVLEAGVSQVNAENVRGSRLRLVGETFEVGVDMGVLRAGNKANSLRGHRVRVHRESGLGVQSVVQVRDPIGLKLNVDDSTQNLSDASNFDGIGLIVAVEVCLFLDKLLLLLREGIEFVISIVCKVAGLGEGSSLDTIARYAA